MGRGKPVSLSNGRSWPTISAAKAHFKAMLARYRDNEVVEDRDDHEDLVALVERYDETVQETPTKIGCGIDHFERRRNQGEGWSSPSFWVIRTDGSATDFSYHTATEGVSRGLSKDFADACRQAVAGELLEAKRRFYAAHADVQGRVPCEITGALLAFDEAHLDHAWPTFGQIVAVFRAARGWDLEIPEGVVSAPGDAQARAMFTDKGVEESFRQTHRRSATLMVVGARENLAKAGRQRRPKPRRPVRMAAGE